MTKSVQPSSLSFIHDKIQGDPFSSSALKAIISDINQGLYSSAQIACFLTASASQRLTDEEVLALTKAMMRAGPCLQWDQSPIVDKHCVGGLPGNRTTPIVVAVLAGLGLTIPKTSSRAITSAAGTADVMEVLTPVHLSIEKMRDVVLTESGCIVWGGAVGLSPVDDDIVRVARDIGLDGDGQLVASILSKKLAAGSTHIVIDIPVGPTAKIETYEEAIALKDMMEGVAKALDVTLAIEITDGCQPIGWGIGPALEARDVLAVLQRDDTAPPELRDKAILLAGAALELVGKAEAGKGQAAAYECLTSGRAWTAFKAICIAQGGLQDIPIARYTKIVKAPVSGILQSVNNRRLSRIAKLAGAPEDKTAGIELFTRLGDRIQAGQSLFTVHSNSKKRLDLAIAETKDCNPMRILENISHGKLSA